MIHLTKRFDDTDMRCRSPIFLLIVLATVARAEQIFLIRDTPARTLFLKTDSVRRDTFGNVDFTMKSIAKRGYRPTGASETIAIALTDYQMDCWRNRFREAGTRYVTDEDKDAGRAPDSTRSWAAIAPGSDLDVVRKKIC
ncbi:hypothetical protein [Burkholderia ambifaria]|uniref:hypothetical protein n=1 Tax=Burkholderia ambifaria TaxID=152480 RepID=UPI00158831DE|nr:hypothetical protein [Burkholderia ambifaria]